LALLNRGVAVEHPGVAPVAAPAWEPVDRAVLVGALLGSALNSLNLASALLASALAHLSLASTLCGGASVMLVAAFSSRSGGASVMLGGGLLGGALCGGASVMLVATFSSRSGGASMMLGGGLLGPAFLVGALHVALVAALEGRLLSSDVTLVATLGIVDGATAAAPEA